MSNPPTQKFWVIIPAAGIGSRMQASKPKQYLKIEHSTILEHTLLCFLEHPAFEKVFVGISKQDTYFEYFGLQKIPGVESFYGGTERSETVLNGLAHIAHLARPDDWVWVHDAARPCLSTEEINLLIEMLNEHSSGLVLGVPISDTIKRVFHKASANELPEIKETVDRSALWRAMTPQIFKYSDLRNALEYCRDNHLAITDEASAIEKNNMKALMVQGSEHNIKVTLPVDLHKVQQYIAQKQNPTS